MLTLGSSEDQYLQGLFFLNYRMVDRLRLVMLFFITQAVPQEMRNQLFQLSRCNYADREIANNLEFLGVKLDVVGLTSMCRRSQ